MNTMVVDGKGATRPFPHVWQMCVGSCHALTALREDWRRQLRLCHQELEVEYVRFHGLLNDDMSVCLGLKDLPGGGQEPVCSFYNVDSIFDFLIEIGMKPFVELSFMPAPLASGTQTCFHYRANVTPPKDYTLWERLIEQLARHCVARYGISEVSSWPFEVWNEPNLNYFWSGDQAEYFKLYRHAASAIKRVSPKLRVGGPATARDGWVPEMIEFCRASGTPLDFVSTHQYPTDVAVGNYSDMEERMAKAPRGVLGELVRQTRAAAGDRVLYYTEWHNSPSSRDLYHDTSYAAAFAVKTIADVADKVACYSFWTFSDIFEEGGFPSEPFHGGFGLLNLFDVPKPVYRAFELLNTTGTKRLEVTGSPAGNVELLATRKPGRLVMIATNHNVPRSPIANEDVELVLRNCRVTGSAELVRIDDDHANPRRKWIDLGSPVYPDRKQVAAMMRASQVKRERVRFVEGENGGWTLRFCLPPHGTVGITVPIR